jgi:serine/threonine protein kinase/Tol biopolymer transport system component
VTTDPERRRRIEDICDAALERDVRERPAFVVAACGGDEALRRDVEALLGRANAAEHFLSAPIGAVAASVLAAEHGTSLVGRQIGSYKILGVLGAGGMGDVYRAHDTKLRRDVAIKVVADAFLSNPERLARFEREAQVLATLNHPHIGAIYGLEEADGIRGLVLELVEGQTIVERLIAGPMPPQEALVAARQIADALETAHEKGIVHRDLKPANIKITPDGIVKVLDFGLAKVFARAGAGPDGSEMPTIASEKTQEGVIAGTVAYMSPEQARGKEVDKRTDIWAFGCVLYEMLTARRAFGGETASDTIAAILEREPDWSVLPARTPASIRRLLQRCLEKDQRRRVRDIGDARIDIEEALAAPVVEVSTSETTGARHWRRRSALIAGAAILLGVTSAFLLIDRLARTSSTLENPLDGAAFSRLTDFEGTELDAAISPDGKSVVYVSDRDGPLDVHVTQVGSGVFRNITEGRDSELPAPIRATGFSADGSQIWLGGGPRRRLQSVPLMGGAPRPFLNDLVVNIAWSRDGSRLAYHTRQPGDPIYVANRDGTDARQVFINSNPGGHSHFPIWSPDGRWVYFVSGYPATREMDLWRIDSSGGSPERLTQHNNQVEYPTFIDERTIVYIARDERGTGPWLWAFDVERRVTRRVSNGPTTYTSVSASADGSRLVATVSNTNTSLWSVPLLDRPASESEVRPFLVPTVNATAPRFDDEGALFYRSSGSSGNGLLRYHNGESVAVWQGADAVTLEPAAISPDRKRVAIALRRSGRLRMHVLSTDGAEIKLLSDAIDVAGAASWSPDGKWLVTGGSDATGTGLFKIPIDGGVPEKLVKGQALDPIWSPNGDLIVYAGPNVGSQAELLAIRPDGTQADRLGIQVRREGGGSRARFLRDGTLVYMQGTTPAQDFWLLDLVTKQRRPLTRLSDQAAMWSFDVSPDGKQIVFDRSRFNSHIVVIDLARREPR